tara:strand:- start:463 stop:993 length:531 start_codon:yes stop_codon:yes gene_type:complete
MSDQGLAIFSPFKIALVIAFTFLAWGDLVHGDQIALMVESLIIGLYLNDLYSKKEQIINARRLTFREFIDQVKKDWIELNLKSWFLSFFNTSTKESKKRFNRNLLFLAIILAPAAMNLLRLTASEQEGVISVGFIVWSVVFIYSNLKEFKKTKQFKRLLFSNLGVYFLICSLLLVL